MPVSDKCLSSTSEYINISRNQHDNYLYSKSSSKYCGVKYPLLGRNINTEGIKHTTRLLQHAYLQ